MASTPAAPETPAQARARHRSAVLKALLGVALVAAILWMYLVLPDK